MEARLLEEEEVGRCADEGADDDGENEEDDDSGV